ncbi:TonB-dependent receptor [Catenovulum sediminis]|uniref:TonB-dependent receptor n=1 Tax=Catenovulum sediminis TaxID=1740262 RepID=A0ABV1RBU5_9ALTE|nr:TonB-dependent receptor [Catenovulum sediminis]
MRNIPFAQTALTLALATAIAPAFAEQADEDTEVQAQNAESSAETADETTEIIQVKGLRSSLMKAQDIKMNSDSFVDAIVAEDIGKLPDVTAAESIARIAGVQVTRYNDEANAILIRGLPDITTTYNGREFFTAELRRGQLQDFPSQALAGIEVYKSGTADLVEPGLAGLVNLRTRRPFDFEGEKFAGGLHYGYNDQSEKASPAGNLLYSNRWNTSIGEVGFLGNLTYAQSKYYNGLRYNSTWNSIAVPWWEIEAPHQEGGFVMPAQVGIFSENGKRSRPSANFAVQWRPDDKLEVYVDGIYQGFRGEGNTDNIIVPTSDWNWLHGNGADVPFDVKLTNLEFVEGTNNLQVASMTKSQGLPPHFFRSTGKDYTNTYQFAAGAKYISDDVKLETDLAYTDSEYHHDAWSWDTGLSYSPTFNINFIADDGAAVFEPLDWDPTDESTYEARGFFNSVYDVAGSGWQWRTDLEVATGLGDWLHTVKTGVRWSDRRASKKQGARYAGFWEQSIKISDIEYLDMALTHDPFRSDVQKTRQYLAPTRDSIRNNADKLREMSYNILLDKGDSYGASLWESDLQLDPALNWQATETTFAAYVQTKSYFDIGDVGVDVFSGLRVTQTISKSEGFSTVVNEDGERIVSPAIAKNTYTDVLPNISFRAQLTDDLQMRGGFTQTRTKPNFGDLNPALNITQRQDTVDNPNIPDGEQVQIDAFGSSGNPDLKSLTSDNYDLSLEYYFSQTGYVSGALFYKELDGFINWYTRFIESDRYGLVQLHRPENAAEGKLEGWEINASTFLEFDFMPKFMHAFGLSANVTQLEGYNKTPKGDGTFEEDRKIPGLSKMTYNAAVFYEKDNFSMRLSYNKRDAWVNWYGSSPSPQLDGFLGNQTKSRNRLDFGMSYNINDNFTVYFDMANILAKPFENYTVNSFGPSDEEQYSVSYVQDLREEGRYFGGGVRFSF